MARVVVARKEIFNWGKLYDACTNLQTIVDGAMAKAAARTGRPLSFLSVEACRTEEAMRDLVGQLANLVVLRSTMDGTLPFRRLLRKCLVLPVSRFEKTYREAHGSPLPNSMRTCYSGPVEMNGSSHLLFLFLQFPLRISCFFCLPKT